MQCIMIFAKIKKKIKMEISSINHQFQKIATDCEARKKNEI